MKKILIFLILFLITFNAYWAKLSDFLNPIPKDFRPECFEYYKKIEKKDIFWKWQMYEVVVNKDDLFITNFGFILPYKKMDSGKIKLRRFYYSYIELYSWYNCKEEFNAKAKEYKSLKYNHKTKTVIATLEKNPKFKVFTKKDFDNDWVEDEIDNCPYRFNPNQEDINGDSSWDVCMDDDGDDLIWYFDNCPNIYNPKQLDRDINWIWDACESDIDSDNDWIIDIQDNCKDIKNPNQKDDDNDWIWNMCDNCLVYNIAQSDKNNDWVWDACEDTDNDWISDWVDNCIDIKNPDQQDENNDWIWNVCEKKEIKIKENIVINNKNSINTSALKDTIFSINSILLFILSIIVSSLFFFFKRKNKK